MQELEKIIEKMKEIKDGNRKEKLYAKYPPNSKNQEVLNAYSQGYEDGTDNFYNAIVDDIRKYVNDDWISVDERLPEVFGKYWATIRYDDGRISEPIVVDFRGVRQKYVVDTPNGREYETWGIDTAFHGSRVIAWRPYHIPEPYRPEVGGVEKPNET